MTQKCPEPQLSYHNKTPYKIHLPVVVELTGNVAVVRGTAETGTGTIGMGVDGRTRRTARTTEAGVDDGMEAKVETAEMGQMTER